jgi:hypothetical protein
LAATLCPGLGGFFFFGIGTLGTDVKDINKSDSVDQLKLIVFSGVHSGCRFPLNFSQFRNVTPQAPQAPQA